MTENKDISKKIQDHERRILALEKMLSNTNTKKLKIRGNKHSISDHVIELRNSSFFSQPKTAEETHAKLGRIYPCELNRVAVALVRLTERKQLRKASKVIGKKKYIAYVW